MNAVSKKVAKVEAPKLSENTVCLAVSKSLIGLSRSVPKSLITVDADKRMVHVSKSLYDSDTLRAIIRADDKFRVYLQSRAVRNSIFKSGIFLLSVDLVEEVNAKAEAYMANRQDVLVPAFVDTFLSLVNESKERLGAIFNPSDYPSPELVASCFSVDIRYWQMDAPTNLKTVAPGAYQAMLAKAGKEVELLTEETRIYMRSTLAALTKQLAEKLSPTGDGKKRALVPTAFDKLTDYLAIFDKRLPVADDDLRAEVTKLRAEMSGLTVPEVRSDEALRAKLAGSFAEITANLDKLVADKKGRKLEMV